MGNIKGYGANTYRGLVRNYNEDRVSIIINMAKPENYTKKNWPKISFFGIYDGHGGSKCADFLRDTLHKIIFSNEYFPENAEKAIKNAFLKTENEFINKIAIDKNTGNELSNIDVEQNSFYKEQKILFIHIINIIEIFNTWYFDIQQSLNHVVQALN